MKNTEKIIGQDLLPNAIEANTEKIKTTLDNFRILAVIFLFFCLVIFN